MRPEETGRREERYSGRDLPGAQARAWAGVEDMSEHRSAEERPRARPWGRLLALGPALVGVAGVSGSLLLWHSLRQDEVRGARAAFELSASQRVARVQSECTAALEQLRSVVAFFDSSETVEPEEFRTFTASALRRKPALRAFLWIARGVGADGTAVRVTFAEGDERSSIAPGTELGGRPEVMEVLERAAGELALSGPVEFPGAGGQRVFAALPVRFHHGEHTGELQGHVALLLDVERLLPPEELEIALLVEDVTGTEPVRLAGAGGALTYLSPVQEIGGRRWRVAGTASSEYLARHTSGWPILASVLGLLVTASAVVTMLMAASRREARALVERRSEEVLHSYETLASEAEERLQATRLAQASQEQLRQILDLVPSQIYVKDRQGRMVLANQATAEAHATSVRNLTQPAVVDGNADAGAPSAELEEDRLLMNENKSVVVPARSFVDGRGRRRILHVAKIPYRVHGSPALLHVATDVTETRQAEDVLRTQNLLLGELARGVAPELVLHHVIAAAEKLVPDLRCSVLLLGPDGRHLVHGLAPSLPEEYSRAVDGLEIGPMAGSCGAAAHLGQRFIVRDVMQHENWAPYREIARRASIRACWSEPIRSADGEILGTFAMYYSEPRAPEPYEERFIESMAYLAGIAIERGRLGARA
jgi:PAS domain S-box-containing protein